MSHPFMVSFLLKRVREFLNSTTSRFQVFFCMPDWWSVPTPNMYQHQRHIPHSSRSRSSIGHLGVGFLSTKRIFISDGFIRDSFPGCLGISNSITKDGLEAPKFPGLDSQGSFQLGHLETSGKWIWNHTLMSKEQNFNPWKNWKHHQDVKATSIEVWFACGKKRSWLFLVCISDSPGHAFVGEPRKITRLWAQHAVSPSYRLSICATLDFQRILNFNSFGGPTLRKKILWHAYYILYRTSY